MELDQRVYDYLKQHVVVNINLFRNLRAKAIPGKKKKSEEEEEGEDENKDPSDSKINNANGIKRVLVDPAVLEVPTNDTMKEIRNNLDRLLNTKDILKIVSKCVCDMDESEEIRKPYQKEVSIFLTCLKGTGSLSNS